MRIVSGIFLTLSLLAATSLKAAGQNQTIQKDTAAVKQVVVQSNEAGNSQNNVAETSHAAEQSAAQSAAQSEGSKSRIKEVKSAKPDMSKARGARPPSVGRPAGSRIPAGAGKPRGAGRKPVR